ncbi:hypothetical protein [Vulcanisaeta distributa]|uniref:Uncharacterized protein n=1 Tax=Vulcanisaeta distributa (strain DSM 14429 / JCM 11212 / NBRC 100878 / IC-017) TaxID=572478 RepID=E1QTM2_VULDI|nr:hypothetical protein [Vulcanisaeta distributa]ADN49737.1 hypothetical protein Vdis_0331 [Vulcanisaeta distributa DSM 14429]
MDSTYDVYLPWLVRLEDGTKYRVPLSTIMMGSQKHVFIIKIPPHSVHDAALGLMSRGFKPTMLSINRGELYSLAMRVYGPWELHARIFSDGVIEAEAEISRDYLQHLVGPRFNVVYEVYDALRHFVTDKRICIKPMGKCISDIIENVKIELRAPRALIPWKPIMAAALLTLMPMIDRFSFLHFLHLNTHSN